MNERKTVLVTGSSRGIGKAVAESFAVNGFNVVLNCVNNVTLMDEAVLQLKKINENVIGIRCDVSDYSQAKKMFEQIEQKFGSVDILVNNAGVSYVGLFNEMEICDARRITEANFYSVMNCSHIAVSQMIRAQQGVILNMSSIWGNVGASCEAVYSASKGAINSFTKALAKELAPSGIRVNAIALGACDTEMNSFLSAEEKQAFCEQIPAGRFCSVLEASELAFFLCSDKAKYLTGQVVTLDGGLT